MEGKHEEPILIDEAKSLASELGLDGYYECSALENTGVDESTNSLFLGGLETLSASYLKCTVFNEIFRNFLERTRFEAEEKRKNETACMLL